LRNRLTGLKPDILMDPIYIGLFGSTGAGKSTLLNTIIDKNFFLPVSGTTSCTSCVVQVNSNHSKQYEAKIHLLTPEEWKDELKGLVALAELDDDEDDNVRKEAVSKITAIYGEGAETKSYEELCRMSHKIGNSKCIINLKKENKEDLSKALRPYVSTQSSHGGASEEDGKGKLWPLIKHVEVSVPRMEVVPEGVIFVDIPGMGDFNSKRDAMWKENINKCSVIWVVSSIERIKGDQNHETLLKEGMKAFQRGMCRDISLVVTKSDQMELSEYINKHDAILERNETVKRDKMQMMKKNLEKQLPSDSRVLRKADLVYTVSAREYWNGETLNKEETEIPKLRDYIRMFYVAQKRDILKDYVTEALVIFSLIQSLQSNQETQYQCGNMSHMKDFVQKIIGLGEDIEKCFTAIEQPLIEGVDQAKKLCTKSIDKLLNRVQRCQGFHRTLKAVCLNKGVYASRIFGRIDINNSLAQPIYENIDMSFGNIFRIQMGTCSTLKTCLDLFKDAMKQQLQEAMESNVSDRGVKFRFLQQETDFIFRETEKVILQKKAEIYNSLSVSIQDNLLPFYEEAARQSGTQAYRRMQTILRKGIMGELESGMFEKARDSMREHFQALK
ncbi:SLIP GTPase, partial [Bucorvus abyssinicus]|nr:SLIP GTPase [Bucorvus abyssinicus]